MSETQEPVECASCGQQFTDRQRWGNALPPHDCPPLADWELELLKPQRERRLVVPSDADRAHAAEFLDYLTGDWRQQVEQLARAFARVRSMARIAQLREAADVLHDRAEVMEWQP